MSKWWHLFYGLLFLDLFYLGTTLTITAWNETDLGVRALMVAIWAVIGAGMVWWKSWKDSKERSYGNF